VVDPGDDQVRALAEQPEFPEANAVDRRAFCRKARAAVVELDLLDPDRRVGGDSPGGAAAIAVRRDHPHVDVVELTECAAQGVQALGADAIVVRQQDDHPADSREGRNRD
jgi:hypothetical protein